MRKNLVTFILFLILIGGFLTPILINDVEASPGGDVVNCFDTPDDPQCQPPRLKGVQVLAVRIIYLIWGGGIIGFTIVLMVIGYEFMLSGADSTQKQALGRRGLFLIVSIIVFFAAQPLAATLMKIVISNTTDCYTDLDDPGFTFFFEDVCTGT